MGRAQARRAQINEADMPIALEQNIGWLHITMDQIMLMQIRQGLAHLLRNRDNPLLIKVALAFENIIQGFALKVFLNEVSLILRTHSMDDMGQIALLETTDGLHRIGSIKKTFTHIDLLILSQNELRRPQSRLLESFDHNIFL